MMPDGAEQRIALLEAKVQELDALVNLALRLLAVEKPVSALLERYGATQAEDLAVHALLADVAKRAERGGMYAPSFRGFQNEIDGPTGSLQRRIGELARPDALRDARDAAVIGRGIDTLPARWRGLESFAPV